MSGQNSLPLANRTGFGRMYAHGALIDFNEIQLYPTNVATIGRLLATIVRYGRMAPLRPERRCTTLFHSALVGEIAQHLATGPLAGREIDLKGSDGKTLSYDDPLIVCTIGLYGAFHDVGKIFGGDLTSCMPDAIVSSVRAYQEKGRFNLQRDLGLPLPSNDIKKLIRVADRMAVGVEHAMMFEDQVVPVDCSKAIQAALRSLKLSTIKAPAEWVLRRFYEPGQRYPKTRKAMSMWRRLVVPRLLFVSHGRSFSRLKVVADVDRVSDGMTEGLVGWARERIEPELYGSVHDLTTMSRSSGAARCWKISGNDVELVRSAA